MPEDISSKDIVLTFLKRHPKTEYNLSELYRAIKEENNFSLGYQTVCKYVDVLIAEGNIMVKDYGVVKVVWYEGK